MKIDERGVHFAVCASFFTALQLLAIPAQAKPPVTFISPCECMGNHGVSRWAAKTDTQEPPPNNIDIKRITPAQIYEWRGPGETIGHRSGRIPAENQWYAVTGRIDNVRIEDDGDIHIVLGNADGHAGGIVVELPLGPRWCEMRKTVFSWTNAHFPLSPGKDDKFKLIQHPIVTVVGKAFYDIDHSGNDMHNNRRNYDQSLAVWEIHPVMNMAVGTINPPPTSAAAAPTPAISVARPSNSPPPVAAPIPQPTATSEQFVTLTKPVTIQVPYGTTVLQPGMKLPVLSRDSQSIDVRYMNARYAIPITSTDSH
jgi:hypothetical protein